MTRHLESLEEVQNFLDRFCDLSNLLDSTKCQSQPLVCVGVCGKNMAR